MSTLQDIYLLCGGIGFLWIIGTAIFGFANAEGDGGTDAAGGDDIGITDAGSGDTSFDATASGDTGDLNMVQTYKSGMALERKRLSPSLLVLKLLSPSTITSFMFFFGVAGFLLLYSVPAAGMFSLVPAVAAGVAGYMLTSAMTSWLVKRMHQSNTYSHQQVIGRVAELTVPISEGGLGEVTYTAGGVRDTSPARAADPKLTIKKGSRVILLNVQDGIFYVEPCTLEAEIEG